MTVKASPSLDLDIKLQSERIGQGPTWCSSDAVRPFLRRVAA